MSTIFNTLPKNDSELNGLIQSINSAYGKYFDFSVSDKRSNKLRDCICEGLGFKNGGYQQLKDHWEALSHYDFTSTGFVSPLNAPSNGALESVAFIAKPMSNEILNFLNTYFVIGADGQLLNSDDQSEWIRSYKAGSGWSIGESRELNVFEFSCIQQQKFPLYYGELVVGYAKNEIFAVFLNSVLLSAKIYEMIQVNGTQVSDVSVQSAWNDYIHNVKSSAFVYESPKKYLELRKDSMTVGICLAFDEMHMSSEKISLVQNGVRIDFEHDVQKDMILFAGQKFDYARAYGEMTVRVSPESKSEHVVDVEHVGSVEWFRKDRIEIVPQDGDYDDMVTYDYVDRDINTTLI